jgi:hypothetical protein
VVSLYKSILVQVQHKENELLTFQLNTASTIEGCPGCASRVEGDTYPKLLIVG